MKNIVVQKFGGTSVRNLECMKQVLNNVRRPLAAGSKVIVVLSAMAGETNRLLALAKEWSATPDAAELDSLVSTGEQISVALFAMMAKDQGIRCRSVLGFQVPIISTDAYGKARIESIDSEKLIKLLDGYDVLVMAGFQGVDADSRITTLGRGGSDTSAVAV
ncbi:MAG: aspartate kinase, partial [Desulfovibrio sp.]|nr:aspartate kinase [Desulfovibrio sp.]